jgi:hypothetical protein
MLVNAGIIAHDDRESAGPLTLPPDLAARVDVAAIFDAQPGELFILLNVANLVPPCESEEASLHGTSAAIEFARASPP